MPDWLAKTTWAQTFWLPVAYYTLRMNGHGNNYWGVVRMLGSFLDALSPVLQSNVCYFLCGAMVRGVSDFQELEQRCVVDLIKNFGTATFMMTDIITREDQLVNEMCFVR